MGKKLPTNENIHIGEIYEHSCTTEDDHTCSFYQVVGLRAKTLVELRKIQGEFYVDETCDRSRSEVRVRPLPGQFEEGAETFTVRAGGVADWRGGRKRLCTINSRFGNWLESYYEVREGEAGDWSGVTGYYELKKLEKEGKLPPWMNKKE